MRVVTNPGSNIDEELARSYDIATAPQSIVVDGVEHDTHADVDFADIDRWVATAKEHPYTRGSSPEQFADLIASVTTEDDEVVAIMTSRKLINSYATAHAALRLLRDPRDIHVEIHDSRTTDLGAGLQTLLAASAARASVDRATLMRGLESVANEAVSILAPDALDNLVKGGRASYLRAWLASMLSLRPIIGMVDGDLTMVDRQSRQDDAAPHLVELAASTLGRGRAVWCGVVHGGVPEKAQQLADEVKRHFDVRWTHIRPFHVSIYLHTGPRSLGLFLLPIDRLPWTPIAPRS
jgi:DegV family protein with EDD domain